MSAQDATTTIKDVINKKQEMKSALTFHQEFVLQIPGGQAWQKL
jgi:hypothetical protein